MSTDDRSDKLRKLLDSGKIDGQTFHALKNDPVQATQVLQNDEANETLRDIKMAVFGNERLGILGVIPTVSALKAAHYQLRDEHNKFKYMGLGMAALVSGIIAIISLVIEAHK